MNISYKYIMLAAACLLTACQSNELSEDWTNGSQDANIVKVNATIAGLKAMAINGPMATRFASPMCRPMPLPARKR